MRSLMHDISYGHGGSEVRLRKLRGHLEEAGNEADKCGRRF